MLLLDADPFGGDIRAGLGGGEWPSAAGLADAVVDLRSTGMDEALRRRVHRPAPHAPPVLAGLGCVGQAPSVAWTQLATALGRMTGADTIADCGRYAVLDGVIPLLRACEVVVLVVGSGLRAVRTASRVAPLLREELGVEAGDIRVSVLVVGPDEPYSSSEIAAACELPLLGELPRDRRSADVWSEGVQPARAFDRSPLQRGAHRIAAKLVGAGTGGNGAA
ncbi:hypothetical protein [Pseudonocardia sediminis]|uniref:hypothetical protein n=1 Tax=Pseudonocardia sediminis TaxID=1397368 RepID=UPI001028B958|nr:hypothetical protein [Pseudonocardia sediminis]